MNDKQKIAIGIGGILAVLGISALTKKTGVITPPIGTVNFAVKIVNLPTVANKWGCAFQDTSTGEYYPPTNIPKIGNQLFDSSGVAELSVPISLGILSISAFLTGASSFDITQTVNYQINMSVVNNNTYIFDFSIGSIK